MRRGLEARLRRLEERLQRDDEEDSCPFEGRLPAHVDYATARGVWATALLYVIVRADADDALINRVADKAADIIIRGGIEAGEAFALEMKARYPDPEEGADEERRRRYLDERRDGANAQPGFPAKRKDPFDD